LTFFDYPTGGEGVPEADARILLPDAPEQDWAALLGMATMRRVAAGETLISPGSGDRSLYLILEGQLEVLVPSSRRKWRQAATVGPGGVIGELSFFDGIDRSELVRTLTPVAVAELSHDDFAALGRTRPEVALSVAMDLGRLLAQRVRQSQTPPAKA
jgi:CRP/FNR family transcriptional regulator, cyclic AMP receptor protein